MAFNALHFRHEALNPLQSPITSPAYFEAFFNAPPKCLQGPSGLLSTIKNVATGLIFGDNDSIRLRVKAIDLPQRQVETQPRFANGPMRMMPYGLVYSTINLEIIESDRYKIRRFFEEWHDKVFNKSNAYAVEYYSELIADKLTIVAYSPTGIPVRMWEMTEAYPIAINSSQMNWDSINQYLVINIEIAFHEWTSSDAGISQFLDTAGFDIIGAGVDAAANAISNL